MTTAEKSSLDIEIENSDRILDLNITVHVNLGKITMTLNELLGLMPGHILELEGKVDDPLDLSVNNVKSVAKGEVVTIGENLGLRILENTV